MSDEFVKWLSAQFDADAAAATEAMRDRDGVWSYVESPSGEHKVIDNLGYAVTGEEPDPNANPWWTYPHIARHNPARVLREIDAKRRILDLHDELENASWRDEYDESTNGQISGLYQAIRLLALRYADRPGYRAEWKP